MTKRNIPHFYCTDPFFLPYLSHTTATLHPPGWKTSHRILVVRWWPQKAKRRQHSSTTKRKRYCLPQAVVAGTHSCLASRRRSGPFFFLSLRLLKERPVYPPSTLFPPLEHIPSHHDSSLVAAEKAYVSGTAPLRSASALEPVVAALSSRSQAASPPCSPFFSISLRLHYSTS